MGQARLIMAIARANSALEQIASELHAQHVGVAKYPGETHVFIFCKHGRGVQELELPREKVRAHIIYHQGGEESASLLRKGVQRGMLG